MAEEVHRKYEFIHPQDGTWGRRPIEAESDSPEDQIFSAYANQLVATEGFHAQLPAEPDIPDACYDWIVPDEVDSKLTIKAAYAAIKKFNELKAEDPPQEARAEKGKAAEEYNESQSWQDYFDEESSIQPVQKGKITGRLKDWTLRKAFLASATMAEEVTRLEKPKLHLESTGYPTGPEEFPTTRGIRQLVDS
ncbi:hypothetical protein LWI29_012787 [Acer saccharum]|uniref:Uncharacterized protein n=1 Tax=Acer saccharum TaxID=4024 RepID=A0AA39TDM4_ACESA|nr:hypothetical protein LWI29_012787 [Acer saccharum]